MAISLNPQAASSRKKMHTQAEYAVMSALNSLRNESGTCGNQTTMPTEKFVDKATFEGSYFFSTDQMNDHLMGTENFSRLSSVNTYDEWNIKHDVDLALCDFYSYGQMKAIRPAQKGVSCFISVKTMNKAVETGKVSIELFSFNNDRPSMKRDGWIKTGCSNYTAICIGTKIVIMSTTELKKLVDDNMSVYPIYTLRAETVEVNRKQNRTYDNASNIIIPVSELLKLSSAKVIDLPEWYATKWNAKADADLREKNKALWS